MKFVISFYNIGITVLSIIFSLFFAALAILMSSSDNDFIEFLEEENDFSNLLWTFKVTLTILFVSLIYCIILYTGSSYIFESKNENWVQHKILFIVFEFLFTYSLLSTFIAVLDTIQFSKFRTVYLKQQRDKKKEKEI